MQVHQLASAYMCVHSGAFDLNPRVLRSAVQVRQSSEDAGKAATEFAKDELKRVSKDVYKGTTMSARPKLFQSGVRVNLTIGFQFLGC